MTDTMKDLIERLESATEGSRELDAEIAETLGHEVTWSNDLAGDPHPVVLYKSGPWERERGACPHFSTSIDSALTLFDDDLVSWRVGDSPGGPGAWVLLADGTEAEGLPLPGKGTPAICIVMAYLETSTEAGT